jgi:sialate O-acetylesterase
MVPTIDIGDPNDLHPPNKAEVGQRLAWAALAVAYGVDDPTLLSPRIEEVVFRGDEVRLKFSPVEAGLSARTGIAEGFEIARDRDFVPAQAEIEAAEIVVRSDLVRTPRAVRYAFSDRPIPNLANRRGLPLTPFRFRVGASPAENSLLGTPPRER